MDDPSGAAKSLVEHLDDARIEMEIRGALMDGNILPGLYALVNAGVAAVLLFNRPVESAVGLALLALGLPFYGFFARRART